MTLDQTIRAEMARFIEPNDAVSAAAFAVDLLLYATGIVGAVLASAVWMKIAAAIVAGTATSTLFILGHDAAHKSLFSSRRLNAIAARLAFFPCLHNYTLWLFQHNRLHHQSTNVRGLNSFSPLSLIEYQSLSPWGRFVERLYRSVPGFGVYYLIERWWTDKFFPRSTTPGTMRVHAWLDFALLIAWLVSLGAALTLLAASAHQTMPVLAIVWGFVLPFAVWNALMGLTAYLQHTNPHLPWFDSVAQARAMTTQGALATHIVYPRWYDVLSHNIMWHAPHHAHPRVPWFRLRSAQQRLEQLLGERTVVERLTLRYLLGLTRSCQLYDYEARRWLDFAGCATTLPAHINGPPSGELAVQ